MLPLALRRRRAADWPIPWFSSDCDHFVRQLWGEGVPEGELTGAYPVDIREEDDKIVVEAEMPGFKRDEIDVQLDGDILRIAAERKAKETKGTQHLSERRFTRVERAFTLPAPVDESKIEAKLEDGVLHLKMSRGAEARPRRIEVK